MKLELKHLAPYLPYRLELKVKREDGDYSDVTLNPEKLVLIQNDYYDKVLPKFRPLSDLTKGIEIYNTIVVSIDYISTSKANSQKIMRRVAHNLPLDNLEYWQVERLFELHFDVFGLIESGLAVKK